MNRRLLVAILFVAASLGSCAEAPHPRTTPCFIALGDAPVRGPADAWVTMLEFSDFQCPYCQEVEPIVRDLSATYPDDLRLVYREFPIPELHSRATATAVAAWCAGEQGDFWGMHDLLFDNHAAVQDADLLSYATSLGLDVPTWQSCIAGSAASTAVMADRSSAEQIGVGGTPTFLINGTMLEGAWPEATFVQLIDQAIADAQASGTPRASYYDSQVAAVGCE